MRTTRLAVCIATAVALAPIGTGNNRVLQATKDNTIYSEGALSNALHPKTFSGRTAAGNDRRALVQFDIAGGIPGAATITSATLRMYVVDSPPGAVPDTFTLHRVTASWGEGTSDNAPAPGGAGAPATVGDATWANRFHPATPWAPPPGGDFIVASSASDSIGAVPATGVWGGPGVLLDVQGWHITPASNHGWIVIGDETIGGTARLFGSVQSEFRPSLTVTFTLPAGYTFCDGSDGSLASCPCNNPGNANTGCDIQQGTGGVAFNLVAQQTTPLNRATVSGTGFPAMSTPTAIVIRAGCLDPDAPIVFGDGLRCVGVPLVRLGATFANAGTSTHTFGHGSMSGFGTSYYQIWFRNTPIMFCDPAAAFNLSGGKSIAW